MSDKLITDEELDAQHAKLMAGIEGLGGSALEWKARALKAERSLQYLESFIGERLKHLDPENPERAFWYAAFKLCLLDAPPR